MAQKNAEKVSPTAHATGYFWYRQGMSHPALATARGKRLDRAFGLLIKGTRALTNVSLEALMLARHRGIDALLTQAIEAGRVTQVVEIAAGLSPRGWNFMQRYGDRLTYLETDLPQMVTLKQRLLGDAGLLSDRHRVITLDALAADGSQSLAAITASLDPQQGAAIITEGLMNYLPPEAARDLWQRIATTLHGFPYGTYLSDFYLMQENRNAAMAAFGAVLSVFVRGRIHVPFHTAEEATRELCDFGFDQAKVHAAVDIPETRELGRQRGADRVRVLEATTTDSAR